MIDILIPNRFTWNSICLTIESIVKRTAPTTKYKIIVCDNSAITSLSGMNWARDPQPVSITGDDGNRREYLRAMARMGYVQLIEKTDPGTHYGHGENLTLLCAASTADYALLLNSNSEVIRADWLDVLVDLIKDSEHDLGVARERNGGNHWDLCWITPTYWPNIMFLNMPLYRRHFADHKWELRQIGFEEFERPEIFAGQTPPRTPERTPPLVFADTGWSLWERLHFENPAGLRMIPLPDNYWNTHIAWRGGIDRNSHRPDHEHVRKTLAETDQRLAALRAEG